MRRSRAKYVAIMIALLTGFRAPALAQDEGLESNLKAAFLYNFTKYIDWQLGPDDTEFVIGVVGSTPVEKVLEQIARTSTVDGRRIAVRHVERLDQVGSCHLLFIAHNRRLSWPDMLAKVGRGEIVVADEKGGANNGAGLNFILAGDKLRFEANMRALASSGLKVSSQLLKLAIIVKE